MNLHIQTADTALSNWTQFPNKAPQVNGIFECHIFCEPLNPSREEINRFKEVCESFNIRPLCIALHFEDKGMVSVLQTTKWYETTAVDAVQRMTEDAKKIQEHFNVIRLKLEAVTTNSGIPQETEEALAWGAGNYFEYHIKLNRESVTPEHDEELKTLAAHLRNEFKIQIPFSCNNLGNNNQRFINGRTHDVGYKDSSALMQKVCTEIQGRGYTIDRMISEFIVWDTNKDLDRGWLEPV